MVDESVLYKYLDANQKSVYNKINNILNNINTKRPEFFELTENIDNFLDSEGEYYERFIVMKGLRGVGKTTILYQLYDYLVNEKNISRDNILYLDLSRLISRYDVDLETIFNIFLEVKHETNLIDLDEKIFLFVDEAHFDKMWAEYGRIIFDDTYNVFTIFTGSSALDLNLNTDAARRTSNKDIFPLSLNEFLFMKHNISLSPNNFKRLILWGDHDNFNKAVDCEKINHNELLDLNVDFDMEFKKFLSYQDIPFVLNLNRFSSCDHINTTVDKIISKDLMSFKKFNNVSSESISRLLTFLARKKPGPSSIQKLSKSFSVSQKTINDILYTLEKSGLIFGIYAYGSAGKMTKKPKEYFFTSPSFKTAINQDIGQYDASNKKCFAILAENLVASTLFKMVQRPMSGLGLYYDWEEKGVDFILRHLDKTIPIEVGIGDKKPIQVNKALRKYGSEFGILVSNKTDTIEYRGDVIHIPLSTFALIN